MTEILYEDFSLWIKPEPEGRSYRVNARCRAGEGSASFELPTEIADLPHALAQLTRDLGNVSPATSHRPPFKAWQIGDRLFQALFSGPVRQLYDRACGASGEPARGVRIKLHFDLDNAALCNLPWELLYTVETRDYLGLNRLSPIVRYLELPRPNVAAPFSPPLRVLLAAANPPGTNPLDLETEADLIRQSLGGPSTEITVLTRASLESIRQSLLRGPYHVLHFMGHGIFDEGTGAGGLLLQSATVSGEVLANHLKGCLPQLVVVNACHSGRTPSDYGHDFFAGIASSLVLAGVPAVVAMRTPVGDRAATAFSKALYRELAAGSPVDAAVAEGRLAVYRTDPFSLEWAIPVLFMRVPDGGLFTAETRQEETSAPPARRFEAEDKIRIGAESNLRARNIDLGNQRGSAPMESSSNSIEIEGKITAAETLTIVNRKFTH